ncbi:MAG TPA: DUF2961 domain-containing protein [Cyclobacteriaceae bacterium]
MIFHKLFLIVVICLFFSSASLTQDVGDGPLGDLFMAKKGGLVQYSSADPTGGNSDRRAIEPGEALVLVDHEGPGIIKRWWITIAPRNNIEIQRTLIIRCYWDDEKEPSVEVPVSDFFGMGFGEWRDYISLPLNMTSGGYNCYWPMPFKKNARIEVQNTGNTPVESFYFNIGVRTYENLPDDALYFHAQYRQVTSKKDVPITILETEGRGHYVGTLLSMQPQQGSHFGYLEGDEIITVDGEEAPSIVGTGTEDYFSSGWYYITGEYAAPYHGVTIKDDENGRINTYRWHIEDPIPFNDSFHFVIEHGGINDIPDVEYASVAYWYQTHPHGSFPPLPEKLLPLSNVTKPAIEAESIVEKAEVTGGSLQVQHMGTFNGDWSGNAQLWWINGSPGDELTMTLNVENKGAYDLYGFFTRARDYGIISLSVNGERQGNLVDLYNNKVEPTGPVSFGKIDFKKGKNELKIHLEGKDVRASGYGNGYLVGIDGFFLRREL